MTRSRRHIPFLLVCVLLGALSAGLCLHAFARLLPPGLWWQATSAPDPMSLPQLTLHYAVLSRVVAALLVGAGLSLAGALMQLVLRNPAAEPATLGVAPGAFLALAAASIWAPALVEAGRTSVALAGGAVAGLLVFVIASRSRFSPQVLLLAGLLVGLFAGAVNTLLIMIHGGLIRLFIWDSGSLAIQDWSIVTYLLPRLLPGLVASLLLIRPVSLLTVSDEAAASLGASPTRVRVAALAIAVWMTTVCVAAVGVVGFVGIAAGETARRLGYRRVREQLLAAPVIGALLLLGTDQFLQALHTPSEIPAGAATAMMGAPLLLWLMTRRNLAASSLSQHAGAAYRLRRPGLGLAVIASISIAAACLSLLVGRGLDGWRFTGLSSPEATLFWRGPRLLAGAAASVLVAISGVIVQRLTLNPLASPELLGISAGAACGVIMAMLFPEAGPLLPVMFSVAGGGLVLVLILFFGRRNDFAPQDLFMVGIAVTTCFSAVVSVLLSSGDPRMFDLLRWLSGSTFLARPQDALMLATAAVAAFAVLPFVGRWLALLPLGSAMPKALGLAPVRSRGLLVGFAAVLVGLSVLMIGPLSFVGLMAPHVARMLGFRRPMAELAASALIGCCLMTVADWLGRNLLFPNQVPAGLVATLIAAPYIFALMGRRA